jgi:uncharacterized protein (DUF2267 family)
MRIRADTESDKAQARLISQAALKTIADKLTVSEAESARLHADLVSAKEKLNVERTMSQDEMRKKLASVESCLEKEKSLTHSLQEKLKQQTYLEGLASDLLRALHKAQDELQVERTSRSALQAQIGIIMPEEASAIRRAY